MIKYIFAVLNSKNPNVLAMQYLLYMTIIYLIYIVWKKYNRQSLSYEGFEQSKPFVLKKDDDIYDDFYSHIYDDIHKPNVRTGYELINVINATEPTTRNSVFLDIGSGTGLMVNELQQAGYRAFGIDKSQSMIDAAEAKYPDCQYKHGDVMEPMSFEKGTFTHIICTYFTIYQIQDKPTFFRNCYHWLKANGYLIIHLVNPKTFDTIVPVAKTNLAINPHKYESSRITDSIVEFKDFQYKQKYDFGKKNVVSVSETFKDNASSHIRQNEQTMYMEDAETILNMAKQIGYISHAMFDLKKCIDDENQMIYILERPM